MTRTKSSVIEVLKGVIYFAKGDNIVDLGMVDELEVADNNIRFRLVFPKLGEASVNIVMGAATKALKAAFGEEIKLEITPIAEKDKGRGPLAGVKHIIAVASGKGGVGKSTVAANLAIALSRAGSQVGLVDADIYGPSVPMMFGTENMQPGVYEKEGKPVIVPIEKYGIKLLSIGYFVDSNKPLVWRGPMATTALNQLLSDADWGVLDFLVIDLPPGTGDIQLTLAQSYSVNGAVIVTTPQKVAFADVKRAATMFKQEKLTIPLLGLIENMAYFTPSDSPEKKYFIFGDGHGQQFADELDIPFLGQIPIDEKIAASGDNGNPIALDENSPVTKAFDEVAVRLREKFQ
ncbi:MAG: Mrp/NBP35 family ATP-binding protein [Bacteroidales bacterium]|jgi:ATP-binding protein involved in chromosome partitioning|nr:Mrp/NBP35 family ATP-binding protein [Bacteroidales bacterium]MDD4086289.1 Mrp/NBP35 family ATP-binding protein [Bacteroidales bacterium]MDY0086712.1 Mrp/NBP35 family ATP-binding protein [Bacteroidales bacterium]